MDNVIDNGEKLESLFSNFQNDFQNLDSIEFTDDELPNLESLESTEKIATGDNIADSTIAEPQNLDAPIQNGTLQDFFTKKSAVDVWDVVVSRLGSYGARMITDKPVTVDDFKLDSDEKQVLSEPLYRFLGTIKFNSNSPSTAFLVAVAIIYGTKLVGIFTDNNEAEIKAIKKRQEAGSYSQKRSVPRGTSTYVQKWKRDENGKLMKDENGNKIANDKS